MLTPDLLIEDQVWVAVGSRDHYGRRDQVRNCFSIHYLSFSELLSCGTTNCAILTKFLNFSLVASCRVTLLSCGTTNWLSFLKTFMFSWLQLVEFRINQRDFNDGMEFEILMVLE